MERETFEKIKFDAVNGSTSAQCALGRCYLNGDGAEKDHVHPSSGKGKVT